MFICVEKKYEPRHACKLYEFSRSLQSEIQEKNFSPASKTCNTITAAGCVMTKWMTKSKNIYFYYICFPVFIFPENFQ